ncbi:MAG: dihydroorotase [Deltaproteobacteria bacterium]|nr:dihydroorotase [Deltaproteobacteria bacterium]
MKSLEMRKPDDWHIHLRDGEALSSTVPDVEMHFARALLMPNLQPPLRNIEDKEQYDVRVRAKLKPGSDFQPYYALYLTDATTPADVAAAAKVDGVLGFKLYPQGATTHSDAGVSEVTALEDVFAAMAKHEVPLCVHAEVTDDDVDIFDREAVFLAKILGPLLSRHPKLRCVVEHLTTWAGIDFVRRFDAERVCASITAHHLFLNRNHLLVGGIQPHHFCLPVAKREEDRKALLAAATSRDAHFFFGSDSAPHVKSKKENACGCAGIYTAPVAMPLLAEAFDAIDRLSSLEHFTSIAGAQFYKLPLNNDRIQLERVDYDVGRTRSFGAEDVINFRDGKSSWCVATN